MNLTIFFSKIIRVSCGEEIRIIILALYRSETLRVVSCLCLCTRWRLMHSLRPRPCSTCICSSLWASCQIRKIAGAHAPGMPGTFSPSLQACDPDMHHGTCVTHVPWCMPGSLTSGFLWNRRRGGDVPGIPGACAICIIRYLVRSPCSGSRYINISQWDVTTHPCSNYNDGLV